MLLGDALLILLTRCPESCPAKTVKKEFWIPSNQFSSAFAVTKELVGLFSSDPPIAKVSKTVVLIGCPLTFRASCLLARSNSSTPSVSKPVECGKYNKFRI